jgi:hypothetical protein
MLAVERPRNFRLMVRGPVGQEADFGANDERFWFWIRRNEPKHVFFARHADAGHVQQLPFQPDWLMEALGVVPIIEEEWLMQPVSASGLVSLVSERVSATGQPVRRVMIVDPCQGAIVAHELHDPVQGLIARAELNDYRRDPQSGIMLPHRVNLDWRQANMSMTMRIGPIEVNPSHFDATVWELPSYGNEFPPLDLGAMASHSRQPRPRPPGRVSLDGPSPQDEWVQTASSDSTSRFDGMATGDEAIWPPDDGSDVEYGSQHDYSSEDVAVTDNSENEPWRPPFQSEPWKPPFEDSQAPPKRRSRWLESTRRILDRF